LQRQAAEDIAQRILHRKRHHGSDHRRSRHDAAQIQPGIAQADQPPDDVAENDKKVFRDAGRPDMHPGQHDAEHQQSPQADHRDTRSDDRNFVEYCCRRIELHRMQHPADELQGQAD